MAGINTLNPEDVTPDVSSVAQNAKSAAVDNVKGEAQGAVDNVKGQAQGAVDNVKGEAQGAVDNVKGQAQGAVDNVKGEAQGAVDNVKGQAQGAVDNVKGEAQGAVDNVKGQAQSAVDNVTPTQEKIAALQQKKEEKNQDESSNDSAAAAAEDKNEAFVSVTIEKWPQAKEAELTVVQTETDKPLKEAVSELPDCTILIKAKTAPKKSDLDCDVLIGTSAVVHLASFDDGKIDYERFFHGFIESVDVLGPEEGTEVYKYAIHIVPGLWFLDQGSHSRSFEDTIPNIVKQIFDAYSIQFSLKLNGTYEKGTYLQYNESDLNFVLRLLDLAGIGFYIVHEKEKHTVILFDNTTAYTDTEALGAVNGDSITKWRKKSARFIPGKVSVFGQDYTQDASNIARDADTDHADFPQSGKCSWSDVIAPYTESQKGEEMCKSRSASLSARYIVVTGQGNKKWFPYCVGDKIKLNDEETKALDYEEQRSWVIVSLSTTIDAKGDFSTEFILVLDSVFLGPLSIGYLSQQVSDDSMLISSQIKRPKIGPQYAKVYGGKGQEVLLAGGEHGKYGSVCVQFPWDENAIGEEQKASCNARVAAGVLNSNGVPRVGTPVLVVFPDNDPNQMPVITECLYSSSNPPLGGNYSAETAHLRVESTIPGPNGRASTEYFRIEIDNKSGAQSVKITNPGSYTETSEKEYQLTVKDGDHVVNVEQGDHATKARNVNNEAQQAVTVKGNQKVSIEASGGPIGVKGVSAALEGTTSTEVKAGANLTLKGAITEVN